MTDIITEECGKVYSCMFRVVQTQKDSCLMASTIYADIYGILCCWNFGREKTEAFKMSYGDFESQMNVSYAFHMILKCGLNIWRPKGCILINNYPQTHHSLDECAMEHFKENDLLKNLSHILIIWSFTVIPWTRNCSYYYKETSDITIRNWSPEEWSVYRQSMRTSNDNQDNKFCFTTTIYYIFISSAFIACVLYNKTIIDL